MRADFVSRSRGWRGEMDCCWRIFGGKRRGDGLLFGCHDKACRVKLDRRKGDVTKKSNLKIISDVRLTNKESAFTNIEDAYITKMLDKQQTAHAIVECRIDG